MKFCALHIIGPGVLRPKNLNGPKPSNIKRFEKFQLIWNPALVHIGIYFIFAIFRILKLDFFSFWFVQNVYQAGGNWFLPQTKIFFGNLIYLWKGKPWSTSWIYMSKLCLWWPTLLYIHVTYMHYAVQVHSIVYWIWHRCEMFLYYIHT